MLPDSMAKRSSMAYKNGVVGPIENVVLFDVTIMIFMLMKSETIFYQVKQDCSPKVVVSRY
jgi:hypothetical protein